MPWPTKGSWYSPTWLENFRVSSFFCLDFFLAVPIRNFRHPQFTTLQSVDSAQWSFQQFFRHWMCQIHIFRRSLLHFPWICLGCSLFSWRCLACSHNQILASAYFAFRPLCFSENPKKEGVDIFCDMISFNWITVQVLLLVINCVLHKVSELNVKSSKSVFSIAQNITREKPRGRGAVAEARRRVNGERSISQSSRFFHMHYCFCCCCWVYKLVHIIDKRPCHHVYVERCVSLQLYIYMIRIYIYTYTYMYILHIYFCI